MKFLGKFLGGGAVGAAGNLIGKFTGDRRERDAADAADRLDARRHDAAAAAGKHDFVDMMNRAVRPLFAYQVMATPPAFVFGVIYHPENLLLILEAVALVPVGLWTLYSIVITFYFSGRMQVKAKMFAANTAAIARVGEKARARRKAEQDDGITGDAGNAVIAAARKGAKA